MSKEDLDKFLKDLDRVKEHARKLVEDCQRLRDDMLREAQPTH